MANKVRESFESIDECAGKQGKQARITNILRNPVLAATEISMAQEEIRHLRCELVWTVLQKAIEKDGAVLSDGAAGDRIRRAVGIMDSPDSVLQCDEGREYQPTINEHRHRGVFFWRCPTDGGWQHQ